MLSRIRIALFIEIYCTMVALRYLLKLITRTVIVVSESNDIVSVSLLSVVFDSISVPISGCLHLVVHDPS